MDLTINGETRSVDAEPSDMLLWLLRDELEMTGTKYGCGAGICGACTVHVDGVAVRACITPVAAVEGKAIRTIEGLADGDTLHPVQQAFIDAQAPQCGWCMSGQIMAAAAFLETNQAPTDDDIIDAMGNNYCRCGCYVRIFQAVKAAAGQTRATTPVLQEVSA